MRRAAEHLPALARTLRPRVVYADLDGTLFGPGGSLFAAPGGGITSRAAEAVAALHVARIELVPLSGRTALQVRETARILGASSWIAELGGVSCLHGEETRNHGAFAGPGVPYEAMARSGAAGLLLDAYPGRLVPHAPWAFLGREVGMLLRGQVDLEEARELLARAGHGWLELEDNGVISRRFPDLQVDEVHAYHLVPKGVSKATAVAADMAARRLPPEAAVAVGDAPSDAALAPHVGAVFVVANGRRAVEAAAPWPDNVYVTEGSHGEGFAEAVGGLLAG